MFVFIFTAIAPSLVQSVSELVLVNSKENIKLYFIGKSFVFKKMKYSQQFYIIFF